MRRFRRSLATVPIMGLICLSAAAAESASSSASDAKIAFSRGNINIGTAIWTADGDGKNLVQLTHPPKSARDNEPTWSPDRRQIAFVRALVVGTNDRGDYIRHDHLTVMSDDGTALRRLSIHSHDPRGRPTERESRSSSTTQATRRSG